VNDVEFLGVAMIALVVLVVIGYIFEDIKIKSTERKEQIIKNHLLSLIIVNNIKFYYSEEEECYLVSSNNKDLGILDVKWHCYFTVNEELAITKKTALHSQRTKEKSTIIR